MYQIIEYKEKYKEKAIEFWLEIYVDEYGIKEWTEGIKNTFSENSFWNLFIVIDTEDNILGTVGIKKHNNKAEIKRLCIKKENRGQGLAKDLIKVAEEYVKKNGIKDVFLYTTKKLENAVLFYDRNGFEIVEFVNDNVIKYEKNLEI